MSTGLSTYNYFMSSYISSTKASRYDAHKRNELKNIYNSIVKMNKDKPVYMFKNSKEATALAINIKESARDLTNTLSSINADRNENDHRFGKKVAYSSNTDVLDVAYIGDDTDDANTSFQIEVNKLAKPQINTGSALFPNNEAFVSNGDYSFDVSVGDLTYELQFSINPGDNNQSIMDRVARLFNKSVDGVDAKVMTNDNSQIYLELTSTATGESSSGDLQFTVGPNENPGSSTILTYLGIDRITQLPSNSSFILNGTQRASFSNTFTVNKNFEVTIKDVSQAGEPTTVAFKNNADSQADNISALVSSYNNMLASATDSVSGFTSHKLIREISSVAKDLNNELEAIGINVEADGNISIDKSLLFSSLENMETADETRDIMKRFESGISHSAKNVLINPMEYTDKTLVAYKNPTVPHFNSPYFTSAYSGMMFNSYC